MNNYDAIFVCVRCVMHEVPVRGGRVRCMYCDMDRVMSLDIENFMSWSPWKHMCYDAWARGPGWPCTLFDLWWWLTDYGQVGGPRGGRGRSCDCGTRSLGRECVLDDVWTTIYVVWPLSHLWDSACAREPVPGNPKATVECCMDRLHVMLITWKWW